MDDMGEALMFPIPLMTERSGRAGFTGWARVRVGVHTGRRAAMGGRGELHGSPGEQPDTCVCAVARHDATASALIFLNPSAHLITHA